jgi:hypothetical protein
MPKRPHLGVVLAAATFLAACALTPSPDDPFAASSGGRRADRRYRVRLEVVCNRCAVTYFLDGRIESASPDRPLWRATFDLYPRFTEAIRLTASGQVDRVRIYVDGALVASRASRMGDDNVVLEVEATVPPQQGAPVPDTLERVSPQPSSTSRPGDASSAWIRGRNEKTMRQNANAD